MKYSGTKTNDESVVNMETLKTELASLVNASPSYVSALNQLASAIASNSSIMSAINQAIAEKASKEELAAVEAKFSPLVISGTITTGTKTDAEIRLLGFLPAVIENLVQGLYTKVVQKGTTIHVWSYEAYRGSASGTIIVLRGVNKSYKISKATSATSWTITEI